MNLHRKLLSTYAVILLFGALHDTSFAEPEVCSPMSGLCYAWYWNVSETPRYRSDTYHRNLQFVDSCDMETGYSIQTGYAYAATVIRYVWTGTQWLQHGLYSNSNWIIQGTKDYLDSEFASRGVPEGVRPSEYLPDGPSDNCGANDCSKNTRPGKLAEGCQASDGQCYAYRWSIKDIPNQYNQTYPSTYVFGDDCNISRTYGDREEGWFYPTQITRYKWVGGKWSVDFGRTTSTYTVTESMKQTLEERFESMGIPECQTPDEYWGDGPTEGSCVSLLCKGCNQGSGSDC